MKTIAVRVLPVEDIAKFRKGLCSYKTIDMTEAQYRATEFLDKPRLYKATAPHICVDGVEYCLLGMRVKE